MRHRPIEFVATCALLLAAFNLSGCLLPEPRREEGTESSTGKLPARDYEQASQEIFLSRFASHEPIYFAVGFNEITNAKFQFSFKYRVVDPEGALTDVAPAFWSGVHFGYTQTSFWDLESASAPFFDTNFRPSLFWFRDRIDRYSGEDLKVSFESGFEHESNGKGGLESRSLNIFYVRPKWNWSIGDDDHIEVAPKV